MSEVKKREGFTITNRWWRRHEKLLMAGVSHRWRVVLSPKGRVIFLIEIL